MYKDIIISLLAAVIIAGLPCFEISSITEKIVMIIGMASAVFIFCLFCEDWHDKWKNYVKRVQKTRKIVRKLQKGAGRHEGTYKKAG